MYSNEKCLYKLIVVNGQISEANNYKLEILDTKVNNKNSKECNLQVDKDIPVAQHSMSHQSENVPLFKAIGLSSSSSSDIELLDLDTSDNYVYNCPVCDQVAGNDTTVCEECSEWFHFDCVGDREHRLSVYFVMTELLIQIMIREWILPNLQVVSRIQLQ